MADEVPVCDVLCEAMEYLSKLGSNLRTRSENLKEKRIRKDKLKNYHAVQKAADKVLLICQLSKKSLENVELGVRKVLTLMSSSQATGEADDPEPPPSTSAAQDTENYRYFKYRSYKLRVAKEVPVRHFTSVRVLARNMQLSVHDNYPVYHNCKLYRARKRREKEMLSRSMEKIRSANVNNSDEMFDEVIKTATNDKSKLDSDVSENNTLIKSPIQAETNEDISKHRKMSVSSNKSDDVLHNTENQQKIAEHDIDNLDVVKKKPPKKSSVKHKRKESQSDESEFESQNMRRRISKSNLKRIQVIDDDESSDNNNEVQDKVPEDCEKKDNTECMSLKKSENCIPNKEEVKENPVSPSEIHEPNKIKLGDLDVEAHIDNDKAVDTPKEDSNDLQNTKDDPAVKPLIKCVNINNLLRPDVAVSKVKSPKKKSKSNKSRSSDDEASSKNKENKELRSKKEKEALKLDEEFWMQKRKEVSAFVSKQFVINVIRLPKLSESFLKLHNIRKIVQSDNIICELSNAKDAYSEKKDTEGHINDSLETTTGDSINVVKNALLNDSDSEKSSGSKSPLPLAEIEKTVQNVLFSDAPTKVSLLSFEEINKTIEKVLKETGNSDGDTNVQEPNKGDTCENNISPNESNKIKDALLYYSDSDKEEGTGKIDESEKHSEEDSTEKHAELKKTLLAESDSENTEQTNCKSNKEGDNNTDKLGGGSEDLQENPSKSENTEKQQTEGSPSKDCVSNKLDDSTDISPSKKKKHKRKSMMESIHAKKMLLNYSSSSDTEDDQLRNALKEIKDSLLKGASSSDDEKHMKKSAKQSSSDDEGIDLQRARKSHKRKRESIEDKSDNESKSSHRSSMSGVNSDTRSKSSSKKVRFE